MMPEGTGLVWPRVTNERAERFIEPMYSMEYALDTTDLKDLEYRHGFVHHGNVSSPLTILVVATRPCFLLPGL